jgi:hypothetical protein
MRTVLLSVGRGRGHDLLVVGSSVGVGRHWKEVVDSGKKEGEGGG